MSGISTLREDTDGCAKQYRCDLASYLTNVLSSSYGIIMDCAINAPDHGNNVVYGINATDKRYLKEKMELIDKLASNYTSEIGMISSDPEYVSIKFEDQCIHTLNNKDRLNEFKIITEIQSRE